MDEQRQQGQEDERPAAEATDVVADQELEQAAGGLTKTQSNSFTNTTFDDEAARPS